MDACARHGFKRRHLPREMIAFANGARDKQREVGSVSADYLISAEAVRLPTQKYPPCAATRFLASFLISNSTSGGSEANRRVSLPARACWICSRG